MTPEERARRKKRERDHDYWIGMPSEKDVEKWMREAARAQLRAVRRSDRGREPE